MIYLDNAATSYPKPPSVIAAHRSALTRFGGNPGRGAHRLSLRAADMVYDCRCAVARFFGHPSPEQVVFTAGATAALNLAIGAHIGYGDHILISDREHNAVARTVFALARERGAEYDVYKADGDPRETIAPLIRPSTALVVAVHASNVTGRLLPIAEIGQLCAERGIFFVIDAAQSAGHRRIDLSSLPFGAFCAPAHKGLLGAAGVGIAIFSGEGGRPLLYGGSGWDSHNPDMPATLPERFEAGTLPTPAIAALQAGIEFLEKHGTDAVKETEARAKAILLDGLLPMRGVRLYEPECEGGIIALTHDDIPPEAIAAALDAEGICVRAGYHCAPLAHRAIMTPTGGCVRISAGYATTEREAKKTLDVLYRIFKEGK